MDIFVGKTWGNFEGTDVTFWGEKWDRRHRRDILGEEVGGIFGQNELLLCEKLK